MNADPPVTALVADDEAAPRAQPMAALRRLGPALRIVAEAGNGVDAGDAVLEHQPQFCFLDVRMPGQSGLEVAGRSAGQAPVGFVTAHGGHALDAVDAGALDDVLKPVEDARLARALERVRAGLQRPPVSRRFQSRFRPQ